MLKKKTKITQTQQEEIITNFEKFFIHAEDNLGELFDQIDLCKKFVKGDQWDENVKSQLEAKGKRALTINHILPIRNYLVGVQEENRTDYKIRARKGGYSSVADVMTGLLKHTADLSNADKVESKVFSDGLEGIGWIFLDEDDETVNGQFVIDKPDARDVMFDPSWRDYDPNHAIHGSQYIIRRRMMMNDYVAKKYDQAIESGGGDPLKETNATDIVSFLYGRSRVRDAEDEERDLFRTETFQMYWRVPAEEEYIIDNRDGYQAVLGDDVKYQTIYRELANNHPKEYEIRTRTVLDVHYALIWNDQVLEHKVNRFGMRRFPCAAFCAYRDGTDIYGMIDNLISPQEEENKNRTNLTLLLNQTSNSGWIVKKCVNPLKKKILEMFGSRPDIVLEKDDFGGEVQRIEPNRLSPGHERLGDKSSNDIKEISGVNSANQGIAEDKSESGILNIQRQKQGLTMNRPIFDNFNHTKRIFGLTLMQAIANTNIYTDDEVKEIIVEKDLIDVATLKTIRRQLRQQYPAPPQPDQGRLLRLPEQFRQVGAMELQSKYEEALEIYNKQLDAIAKPKAIEYTLKLLRRAKIWQYGCVVTESPESPTMRLANSMQLQKLNEMYPGVVKPSRMVDAMEFPDWYKDELKDDFRQAERQSAKAS